MIPTLEELRQAYAATRAFTQETPLLEAPALAESTGAADVRGRSVRVFATGGNVSFADFAEQIAAI